MAVLSLFQSSTATCTWRGCVTFRLVYFTSALVGHRIPAWYDANGNIYVGRNEEEVRAKNNIAADVELKTKTFLIHGSHLHFGHSQL